MTKRIYRTAALERMASRDRADEPIRMLRRRGSVVAIVTAVLLVAAAVWAATSPAFDLLGSPGPATIDEQLCSAAA